MIWELETVTPFIIKRGIKFSLFDIYEDNGILFRFDTDKFVENLDQPGLEILEQLFEEYFFLKSGNKGRKKDADYKEIWKKINDFYLKNDAKKYKIYPGIIKNESFYKNNDFDENISVEIRINNEIKHVPYIPGSSLKGSIKRLLIYEYISRHLSNFSFNLERPDENNKMNEFFKETMSSIQISDFYPDNTFKIKMIKLMRSSSTIEQNTPMISSGKFYGEVKVNLVNNKAKENFSQIGLTGNNAQIEEKILQIVLKNSSSIFKRNNEKFLGNPYFGPTDDKNLIAIGFGKGLSLSGFAAVKNDLKLKLPKIKTISKGKQDNWIEQDFQKTNLVFDSDIGGTLLKSKVGIMRVSAINGYNNVTELAQLKYLIDPEGGT